MSFLKSRFYYCSCFVIKVAVLESLFQSVERIIRVDVVFLFHAIVTHPAGVSLTETLLIFDGASNVRSDIAYIFEAIVFRNNFAN